MTTIVVDRELTMAADTQATVCDRRMQQAVPKIFQVHGYTVGVAGRYSEALAFINYLEDALERSRVQELTYIAIPEADMGDFDNFNAIMLTPDGELFEFEGGRYSIPVEAPHAIGSGSDYALAALECGCDAEEAVRVAIKFDVYSGGDITVVKPQQEQAQVTREELSKLTKKELLDRICGDDNTNIGAGT